MTTRALRKSIRIDEEKCNGCGVCVPACAEGALKIVGGKAKLISDKYCDGLGAYLGECPQGAITIEEREAEEFDEVAVKHHLDEEQHTTGELPCGCPSATVAEFGRQAVGGAPVAVTYEPSMLNHWPVQLALIPAAAPFLQGADLVLAADCVPFAYAGFRQDFLRGHALLVACPKLDDFQAHQRKLTDILHSTQVKSLSVVHVEVPCCSRSVHMTKQAMDLAGKEISLNGIAVGIRGDLKSWSSGQGLEAAVKEVIARDRFAVSETYSGTKTALQKEVRIEGYKKIHYLATHKGLPIDFGI